MYSYNKLQSPREASAVEQNSDEAIISAFLSWHGNNKKAFKILWILGVYVLEKSWIRTALICSHSAQIYMPHKQLWFTCTSASYKTKSRSFARSLVVSNLSNPMAKEKEASRNEGGGKEGERKRGIINLPKIFQQGFGTIKVNLLDWIRCSAMCIAWGVNLEENITDLWAKKKN